MKRGMARGATGWAMAAGAALTLLLAGSTAFAADKVVQEGDKTVYKKKTVIDFSDVTLEGELTKPEGSYMLNRGKTKFNSLIKLRSDFNPELQRSTDQL